MEQLTPKCEWIDYGNLILGIGIFALAIVLGYINIMSRKKESKVHIANKIEEWVYNFRKQLSKTYILQLEYLLIKKAHGHRSERIPPLLKNLQTAMNEIKLLFDPFDPRYMEIERLFEDILYYFQTQKRGSLLKKDLLKKQMIISEIAHLIISKQRKKIVELDNSEPII